VPSALSPLLVPNTRAQLWPQDTQSWAWADHLGGTCLVGSIQAISIPCPPLLVQKAWKLSPKTGLQIAPLPLWLVKSIINPLVDLHILHRSVVYEHTHKYSFHYRKGKLMCGRQKGLIDLLQAGGKEEEGHEA